MARAKITYVYNPLTGERDYHIEYQSDQPIHLHERAHRQLTAAIVGLDLEEPDDEQLQVERGEVAHEQPAAESDRRPARRKADRRAR